VEKSRLLSWRKANLSGLPTIIITVIIVPCIGVGMTQGLSQHTNLYPPDQKSELNSRFPFKQSHPGANSNDFAICSSPQVRSHVAFWNSGCGEPARHVSRNRPSPLCVTARFEIMIQARSKKLTASHRSNSTQIYSPDGSADTLSMFLIVQYVFMLVASAALAAVGLAFVN
jgi:hypothetical protein